ncbi:MULTISPECIES: rhamnose ABC transporter substrate-binding protein [unclassified Paenibacillus]|uniref:rhamnose ABC transporter substrate-binding protein n=1 Tax=unclassified Paenibacillus TaxID=185978 RepID=UPI0009564D73|nr:MULTISPECIES: rhamnose ABC transporter substrate-binding protein [unclassified Paenibacillus]ASS65448.1 rhamnose ABC transporter substrate-binding protein [Paenibacillus sp. RUD330]SIQ35922.1 rhamnose transport system substrate-binding protein [Paenibacillus sp. RU4X]SIQ57898.1 rhamnose transport system substrate-binding protein [Paenibacillus sp. RU4T]
MKKIVATLVSAILIVGLLAACSSNGNGANAGQEGTSGGAAGDKQKYAIIFKNTGNPYGEKEMEGYKEAIQELGHEVILKAPDQPTAEAQIAMIDELISQKVSSIAIAANDPDALQPALEKAMNAGIKVVSLDSAVNAESRQLHVNQADPERIGRTLVQGIVDMIGGSGEIAILSATSQATNQNAWIEWMKKELEDPKYKDVKLVKVAYGDDLRDKSVSETEALLKSYPNLKGIIAPTTVGVAAAGKVLTDKGLKGKVQLTGLGLPSEMAEYIESGICQWMYLWNPIDVGYLAGFASEGLVSGKITGKVGDKIAAGKLGEKEVIQDGDGTQIMLGDPFKFDAGNIAEWKAVY